MVRKFLFPVGIFSWLLFATAQGQNRDLWSRISAFDKNKDGTVTREEFGGPPHILARLDKNRDGALTREEVAAAKPKSGTRDGRGSDKAPPVGTPAPKVSAIHVASGETVDLSNPNKISVLVFGSHT